jgi:nucleoside-diphosphate-sugar epimerase
VKEIFVTGGGGYVGTRLIPFLIESGYKVVVYDTFYYGNYLIPNKNLQILTGDLRDINRLQNAIPFGADLLHLACISNDASFALDPELSKTVNFDAFINLVKVAKEKQIRRFVYASTSSVYGISEAENITEDHPLKPITHYNTYKAMCEPILLEETNSNFEGVIFRPATVCGYSPRMRLDLSVNILTAHAITKNLITVFGGSQRRPNLHILDYIDAVVLLLSNNNAIGKIYNVGNENMTLGNIAILVRDTLLKIDSKFNEIQITTEPSDDVRSYHIDSRKIENELGFKPKRNISDAVTEIYEAFASGKIDRDISQEKYHNVATLTSNRIS